MSTLRDREAGESLSERARGFLIDIGFDHPATGGIDEAEVVRLSADPSRLFESLAGGGANEGADSGASRGADWDALVRVAAARHFYGVASPEASVTPALEPLVPEAASGAEVAVVIPCHDDGDLLVDALASLRLCKREHLELMVVDDGSTDSATRALLAEIERLGVPVAYGEHGGPARARNLGIALTSAPFVYFLDADDLLRPGFLDAARQLMEGDRRLGAVFGASWAFGSTRRFHPAPALDMTRLLSGNYLDIFCLTRRAALEDCEGWDERFPVNEDWDLWLSMTGAGWRLGRLADDVVAGDRRLRPGSGSSVLADSVLRVGIAAAVAEKHRDLYAGDIGGVVRNYMTALLHETGGAGSDDPREQSADALLLADAERRVRELSDDVAAARAEADFQGDAARAARDYAAATEENRVAEARALELATTDLEQRLHESETRGRGANARAKAAEARALASAELAADATARLEVCERELEAIMATRTFRWLAPVRSGYGLVWRRLVNGRRKT